MTLAISILYQQVRFTMHVHVCTRNRRCWLSSDLGIFSGLRRQLARPSHLLSVCCDTTGLLLSCAVLLLFGIHFLSVPDVNAFKCRFLAPVTALPVAATPLVALLFPLPCRVVILPVFCVCVLYTCV